MERTTESRFLEAQIKSIEGVIGCVLLEQGAEIELQVFTAPHSESARVRSEVAALLERHLIEARRIHIFELFGDGAESPTISSEPIVIANKSSARPVVTRINLKPSGPVVEAQVSLAFRGVESAGTGTTRDGAQSMRLVAATTLESAQTLVGTKGMFVLEGVALVETLGRQVVLVMVRNEVGPSLELVGSALLVGPTLYESVVRATLDAVNRQLAMALER